MQNLSNENEFDVHENEPVDGHRGKTQPGNGLLAYCFKPIDLGNAIRP